MCHGHPHSHTCGHQSVTWHYCPSALIDLETGYETPCPNITFAASQPSTASCPLANCDFRSAGGGGWTCCKCGGRNTSGWCSNLAPEPKWEKNPVTNEWEWIESCDHGCCRSCVKDRKFSMLRCFKSFGEGKAFSDTSQAPANTGEPSSRKEKKGKDSRKHRGNVATVAFDPDTMASYNITLDYSGKDGGKGSSKGYKDSKSKRK